MGKLIQLTTFLLLYFLAINSVVADVPDSQIKEVNHLFSFMKNSGCTVNRNGIDYPAEEGVTHIERKYNYFKDEIKSTEDFISLSATKSKISGEFYTVTCPGKETIKTQDWLLTELKTYRSK